MDWSFQRFWSFLFLLQTIMSTNIAISLLPLFILSMAPFTNAFYTGRRRTSASRVVAGVVVGECLFSIGEIRIQLRRITFILGVVCGLFVLMLLCCLMRRRRRTFTNSGAVGTTSTFGGLGGRTGGGMGGMLGSLGGLMSGGRRQQQQQQQQPIYQAQQPMGSYQQQPNNYNYAPNTEAGYRSQSYQPPQQNYPPQENGGIGDTVPPPYGGYNPVSLGLVFHED